MAHIPDNGVLRRRKGQSQGHSKLYHAQVGGQMPAVGGDCVNNGLTHFLAQSGQLFLPQTFYIRWGTVSYTHLTLPTN